MASSIPNKDNEVTSAITIKQEMDDEEYQIEIEHLTEDTAAVNSHLPKIEKIEPMDDGAAADATLNEAIPLTEFCRRVITANHPAGEKVRCGVCGLIVNVWARHKAVSVNYALPHVLSHMTIPCYRCKYCDFAAPTHWNMPCHLRIHGVATASAVHYTDRTNDHREEILEMLQLCYGNIGMEERLSSNEIPTLVSIEQPSSGENTGSATISKNDRAPILSVVKAFKDFSPPHDFVPVDPSLMLLDYCQTVIDERFSPYQRIICNVCRSSFRRAKFNANFSFWYQKIFEHVLGHVDASLFLCLQCEYGDKTKNNMVLHMSKIHSVTGACAGIHYKDRLGDFEPKVKEVIRRCFSRSQGIGIKEKKTPPNHYNPSLVRQHQRKEYAPNVLCLQLADTFSKGGAMQCLICHETIEVSNRRRNYLITKHAIDHALVHLGKEIYQCNRCSVKTVLQHTMASHVQETAHDYKDNSATFQEEILAMLERCYNPHGARIIDNDPKSKTRKIHKNSDQRKRAASSSKSACSTVRKLDPKSKAIPQVKRLAIVKFRNAPIGGVFKCLKCFMSTKYKNLLRRHVKACHKKLY